MNIESYRNIEERSTQFIVDGNQQLLIELIELDPKNSLKRDWYIKRIRKILEENLFDPDFTINILSQKMNTSNLQLYRNIKKLTGYTAVEFIRILRLHHAYFLLTQKDITVTEACYQSGFNNVSYFIKCFKLIFGLTPTNFANRYINYQSTENKRIILDLECTLITKCVS
jgi:AraC-like DNA-binding protein